MVRPWLQRVIQFRNTLLVFLSLIGCVLRGDEFEILSIKINGPLGVYTKNQWKQDWPGCRFQDGVTEGHVWVVAQGHEKALRVEYAIGQIGPERGGAGWRFPIGKADTAELTYTVTFCNSFDWVKGGKLPGLSGGPESVTGGNRADGKNGFSARLMWRSDGRGEAYVYHQDQTNPYGDSFPFPSDFRFPTDVPVKVRMQLQMNEPNRNNGSLKVWIHSSEASNERLVVDRSNLRWRSTDSFAIDSLLMETFYGGSNKSWAPSRPSHVTLQGFQVRKR